MNLAVILARGGSRRVPRKNIRPLGGHPLLFWTIDKARLAWDVIDEVVVSSEDNEILEIARCHGIEALKRPKKMAADNATSYPALMHAVDHYPCDIVCLLQPTSPFRRVEDIRACVHRCEHVAPCVVSYNNSGTVPNGAVYVARVQWLKWRLEKGDKFPFDTPEADRYYMPDEYGLDIDTEEDWAKAEAIVAERFAA